ncbi:ankyrin repeat domain-containing protein [Actinoplanes sp. TFC3]|uniref:ankyrin repeat domain-containing protein n=1 Tax=Actinoplanes sp. TFC3 TaxID=1710355 RepID=UPI00082F626C|nr:ankyrin repeat domain-containing protein [Actinoplanes sp. TFC3]
MTASVNQQLIEAARVGDEAAVAQALAGGAEPDFVPGRSYRSAMVEAADGGWVRVVSLLVEAGAHIGPVGHFKVTPLRCAVISGHADVVRYLVERGALEGEPASRTSVLTESFSHLAFRPHPGALATLRALLQAGATPHRGEEAPLISAIMAPVAPAVLRLLLDSGADAGQRRSDGTPAIVVAARRGDHAAVDVLLRGGAEVDAADRLGRTALMHAVERNERPVLATLLTAGASIGTVSADGMTALHLARGWQRQNVEFMLGEHQAGMDDVAIVRTVVRIAPAAVGLAGDPPMLRRLADVIDVCLDDLGDEEWQTRTGRDAGVARVMAERLRDGSTPAAHASWHEVTATAEELAVVRSALVELAYGTSRVLPAGTSRLQLRDALDELDRQLGR